MKNLLFIIVLVSLFSCSKRLGNYTMKVSSSTYKTVKKATTNKELAEVIIDTLVNAHPELAKIETSHKTDTVYLPARQKTKEIPSNLRYTVEDVESMLAAFKKQNWNKLDTMLQRVSEADPIKKSVSRDMIPILAGLKPNSDTLHLKDTLRGIEFLAWMHKGQLVGEEKADRYPVAIESNQTNRNINPSPDCPPRPDWFSFWQTWIACFVIVFLMVVLGFVVVKV